MENRDYKVLSQNALSATTLTDVYTVPTWQKAIVEDIKVCNRDSGDDTFRVSIAKFGDTSDQTKQYVYYDVTVPGNDTVTLGVNAPVNSGDIVRVYAWTANLSVSLFGYEY